MEAALVELIVRPVVLTVGLVMLVELFKRSAQ